MRGREGRVEGRGVEWVRCRGRIGRLPRRAVGRRAARGVERTAQPPHRRGGDAVGEGVGLVTINEDSLLAPHS